MRDFEFNPQTLFRFSSSDPYQVVRTENQNLFEKLNHLKVKYNFPAVHNDVGSLLGFLCHLRQPKVIFEMGSGYGHSAFWYMNACVDSLEKVYLTERREDLMHEFHELDWPKLFKDKMDYHQGDAFDKLNDIDCIDFALIDGQKSDYLEFMQKLAPKLNHGGVIVIDNSYWRGSFLNQEMVESKKSAKNIKELHEFIKSSPDYHKLFLPFVDGVSLLAKA